MQQKAFIAGAAIVAAAGVAWLGSRAGEVSRPALVRTVSAAERPASLPRTVLEAPEMEREVGVEVPSALALPTAEATLRVRVVDLGSRRPLEDVRLVVYDAGVARPSRPVEGTRGDLATSPATAADGEVVFDLPAGERLRLAVRGAAQALDASLVIEPLARGEARTLVVPLEARDDVPLFGVVVDRESGDPIEGAELRLRGREWGEPRAWSATGPPAAVSDALGSFTLERPAGTSSTVQIDAAGYGPATLLVGPQDAGSQAPRTIRLWREATLVVRVSGATVGGSPLVARVACSPGELAAGSEGFLAGPAIEWLGSVSQDGHATVRHLPVDAALSLELLEGDVPLHRHPRRIRLAASEERTVELDLGRGLRLSGLLATAAGDPVAAQELWLVPADRPGPVNLASRRALRSVYSRTRTDANGRYAFDDVDAGEWWIGPAPAVVSGEDGPAPIGRWFRVPRGAQALDLDLVARPGAFLSGRVLSADGTPAPRAQLTYRPVGDDAPVYARADEDGTFRVGPLGPGPHEVIAVADRTGGHAGSAPALGIGGGEPLELRLRAGGTLKLSGLSQTGRLVPIVRAMVTRQDGEARTLAATHRSAYGETSITVGPVEPGRYAISVATRDGHCGVIEGVTVRAGEAESERLIPLDTGGRFGLHNRGEEPARVRVLCGEALLEAATLDVGDTLTVDVPPGAFALEVHGGDGAVVERSLRVRAGGQMDLDLPLRP